MKFTVIMRVHDPAFGWFEKVIARLENYTLAKMLHDSILDKYVHVPSSDMQIAIGVPRGFEE